MYNWIRWPPKVGEYNHQPHESCVTVVFQFKGFYDNTVVKVDGATPKRWLSKGP